MFANCLDGNLTRSGIRYRLDCLKHEKGVNKFFIQGGDKMDLLVAVLIVVFAVCGIPVITNFIAEKRSTAS